MKKLVVLCLLIVLLSSQSVSAGEKIIESVEVNYPIYLNGSIIECENPVVSIDNKTYVSLRDICNSLDADVSWNNEARIVELVKKDSFENEDIKTGFFVDGKWSDKQAFQMEISEETAISLANDVFAQIYGKDYLENSKVAVYENDFGDCYLVIRYKPLDTGGYVVHIRKSDGKIIGVETAE